MKHVCTCAINSPFRWKEEVRPSIFLLDPAYRVNDQGKTASQISSASVEKARAEGVNAGYIRGVSRNREAELLRIRNFTIFSRAGKK